jgi:hypothetical protein
MKRTKVTIAKMDDQAAGSSFPHQCIAAGPVMHNQTM